VSAGTCSSIHRTMETIAILAVALLSLFLFMRLGRTGAAQLPLMGIAAAMGYVAADLISGLVHWIFDTWGSEDTPVIGRSFIAPFREHHRDAASITRHDFIETNGNNSIATAPILVLACFISTETGTGVFMLGFVLFTSLGVLATNQIHKWAHVERAPQMVTLLQRLRLILPGDHHRLHHAEPYQTHYCITTGWMNPLLGAVDFHRRVERAVGAITGRERRCPAPPEAPRVGAARRRRGPRHSHAGARWSGGHAAGGHVVARHPARDPHDA
jgi:hypothetical protein